MFSTFLNGDVLLMVSFCIVTSQTWSLKERPYEAQSHWLTNNDLLQSTANHRRPLSSTGNKRTFMTSSKSAAHYLNLPMTSLDDGFTSTESSPPDTIDVAENNTVLFKSNSAIQDRLTSTSSVEILPGNSLLPSTPLLPEEDVQQQEQPHSKTRRAVMSSISTTCHSKHLHKCGTTVIHEFNQDPSSSTKCKIREEFLDCMVQQRELGCHSSGDKLFTLEATNLIRSEVKSLLWSARGCLFGM